eukprot:scaffold300_cov173-Ochromonas_danica.AAC.7
MTVVSDDIDTDEINNLCGNKRKNEDVVEREDLAIVPTVRANDHIVLVFHGLSNNNSYKPEYTHQLFEDEIIDFLSEDEKGLSITVHIDTKQNLQQNVQINGISSQITRQMLIDGLHHGVPHDASFSNNIDTITATTTPIALTAPIGRLLTSWQDKKAMDDNSLYTYDIYLATSKDNGASTLLHRAEKVAMWYIETADSVDFSDSRWEVLFLYRHLIAGDNNNNNDHNHQFVGYMTLFTFHNPIVGDILRVCQALILPPCQGLGLGRALLLQVYSLAKERKSVLEVTVEDPCPDFRALRDTVDFEWFVMHDKEKGSTSMNQDDVRPSGKELKLIDSQIQVITEMMDYLNLLHSVLFKVKKLIKKNDNKEKDESLISLCNVLSNQSDKIMTKKLTVEIIEALQRAVEDEESYGTFRLRVKRAILKEDKELKSLEKAAMQAELTSVLGGRDVVTSFK